MKTQKQHEESGCTDYLQHSSESCAVLGKQDAESPNPAQRQATHSPLPFKADDCGVIWTNQNGEEPCIALTQPLPSASWLEPKQAEANAQFIVRACNNVEALAEALRYAAMELDEGVMSGVVAQHIRGSLAQWERSAR